MWGRLVALLFLGSALIKTLLLRLAGSKSGVERFDETYGQEGLVALSPAESRTLHRASSCTACGRCDRGVAPDVLAAQAEGRTFRGLQAFVLSGTRSLPDFAAVATDIEGLSDSTIRSGEEECPVGVPILELAQLVRGYAKRTTDKPLD